MKELLITGSVLSVLSCVSSCCH